jgi:predicted nucleic acid-binding protein
MIAYLDASALVKRYVAEAGSTEVNGLISEAEALGTAVISRAEVSAALAACRTWQRTATQRGAGHRKDAGRRPSPKQCA